MNVTERARRSDSLYYDTQVTNRRALCDMIANLESDLEDSKAKNAKTFEVGKKWMAKAARFESENTKLRELLSESFLLMHRGGLTTGAYGRCMELFMDAQTLGIEIPFMHELGIDVD